MFKFIDINDFKHRFETFLKTEKLSYRRFAEIYGISNASSISQFLTGKSQLLGSEIERMSLLKILGYSPTEIAGEYSEQGRTFATQLNAWNIFSVFPAEMEALSLGITEAEFRTKFCENAEFLLKHLSTMETLTYENNLLKCSVRSSDWHQALVFTRFLLSNVERKLSTKPELVRRQGSAIETLPEDLALEAVHATNEYRATMQRICKAARESQQEKPYAVSYGTFLEVDGMTKQTLSALWEDKKP